MAQSKPCCSNALQPQKCKEIVINAVNPKFKAFNKPFLLAFLVGLITTGMTLALVSVMMNQCEDASLVATNFKEFDAEASKIGSGLWDQSCIQRVLRPVVNAADGAKSSAVEYQECWYHPGQQLNDWNGALLIPNAWMPESPGDYWHGESSQMKWCAGRQWGTTDNTAFVDGVQFQTDKSCEDFGLEFVPFHKACPSYPCTGEAYYAQNGKKITWIGEGSRSWLPAPDGYSAPEHCFPCVRNPVKEGGNGLVMQYKQCPKLLGTLGAAQGYMALIEVGVSVLVLGLLYMCGVINTDRSYLKLWVMDLIKEAQGEQVQADAPEDEQDRRQDASLSAPLSPKQKRQESQSHTENAV